MSLHVAHFVPRYPPALGGAESYVHRLSEHLTRHGDEVTVWTTTALELQELWNGSTVCASPPALPGKELLQVRRFPSRTFPLRRYILKALSFIPNRTVQALTQPVNPIAPGLWYATANDHRALDAVHAFAFPYAFPILCALRMARRRRVPFFLTPFLHLGDPTNPRDRTRQQYTRPHLRWFLRKADAVFVQTESERNAVMELGVLPDRVFLQGLGVDTSECTGGDRTRVRSEWGIQSTEFVVGHLANNSVEKGTVDLLQAAAIAGVRVILAGPEMPNFRQFWSSFPRKDLVTRLGPISDELKRDFFAGIDAFALPSRTDSFGLVLLEAWANGKPVLAYRAGGPADLVRHDTDGFLASCGDVSELTRFFQRLSDACLRTRLGEAGRMRVEFEFQWPDKLNLVREVMIRLANPTRKSRG